MCDFELISDEGETGSQVASDAKYLRRDDTYVTFYMWLILLSTI